MSQGGARDGRPRAPGRLELGRPSSSAGQALPRGRRPTAARALPLPWYAMATVVRNAGEFCMHPYLSISQRYHRGVEAMNGRPGFRALYPVARLGLLRAQAAPRQRNKDELSIHCRTPHHPIACTYSVTITLRHAPCAVWRVGSLLPPPMRPRSLTCPLGHHSWPLSQQWRRSNWNLGRESVHCQGLTGSSSAEVLHEGGGIPGSGGCAWPCHPRVAPLSSAAGVATPPTLARGRWTALPLTPLRGGGEC